MIFVFSESPNNPITKLANAGKRPRNMRADSVPDVVRLPAKALSADDIFIRRRHSAPSRNQKKAAPLAH